MINIKNLSFAYDGCRIFDGFSAELSKSVCIYGASGRGKTTLMRLIAGLEKPDSGKITGVPERVSYMFQEDRLLPWFTAEQNVASVLTRDRKSEAREWLQRVELSEQADSFPSEMSGGQQRRMSLARALAYEGELLLLDEPFKGLDEALTERMAELVLSSKTMFIAAVHAQRELELLKCDTLEI